MQGDGDGWVRCAQGHTHWGKFGAAGVMIRQDRRTVLQHRAQWTHEGGTWAVPGGASDSDEDIVTTAFREADEEADIDPTWLRPIGAWVADHDGWAYSTIVAAPVGTLRISSANPESEDMRWWDDDLISAMPLHTGFAQAWEQLTEPQTSTTIVVDGANVVGSRPDGWWNDRLGAARALRDELRQMVRAGIDPGDEHMPATSLHVLFPRVVLVVEGEAAPLALERHVEEPGEKPLFKPSYTIRAPYVPPWWERSVDVVAAPRSGDDEVVAQVAAAQAGGEHVVVVSADRELRDRVSAIAPAARHAGPGWALQLIDAAAASDGAASNSAAAEDAGK
jgi:ADP-ribose pyrophosphatase YjhB (NUDIX family)